MEKITRQAANHKTIIAALILLVYTALFFHKAVFTGNLLSPVDAACPVDVVWNEACGQIEVAHNGLIGSDQAAQFYPWRVLVRRFWRQGIIPLWNPYNFSGYPLLANGQSSVFFPVNLLANLFPLQFSFTFRAVALLFLAAFNTYLLAREVGISFWGGLFAAIAYGFSMPLVAWLGYALVEVACLFPLLLFFSEKLFKRFGLGQVLVLGLALGLMGIAGHPETLVSSMLIWGVYLAARLITNVWQKQYSLADVRNILLGLLAASLLGLGLSAVQIVPTWQAVLASQGYASRDVAALPGLLATGTNSGDLLSLALLVWPNFLGNPTWDVRGLNTWLAYLDFNTLAAYIGFLPLVLSPLALFKTQQKKVVWTFVAVVGVSLMFFLKLPPAFTLSHVSILDAMETVRFRIFLDMSLAVLAGFGFDYFLQTRSRIFAVAVVTVTVLLAMLVGQLGFKLVHLSIDVNPVEVSWGALWQLAAQMPIWPLFQNKPFGDPSLVAFFLPLVFSLCLVALVFVRLRPTLVGIILVVLLMVDMFIAGSDFNTAVSPQLEPTALAERSETITLLKKVMAPTDRLAALGVTLLPNSTSLVGVSDARGYDLTINNRYYDLFEHSPGFHLYGPGGFFLTQPNPLLRLVGTDYLLSPTPLAGLDPAFTTRSGLFLYRLPQALPRAFGVSDVRVLPPDQVRQAVLDNTFDPAQTALIEQEPPAEWQPSQVETTAAVTVIDYQPTSMTVQTDSPAPFFLVLTDNYDVGWRVYVGGAEQPLYRTDYILRGLFVPAGRHRVDFVYDPLSFKVGVAVSLFSLLLVAGLPVGRRFYPNR